jgi:type IV pilus assembly protein PilA
MKALVLNRKALRSNSKKGFTLVEVIVVLVILAILMAIAVPSLTGYIDKARQQGVVTQARTVQVALQTIGTDVISSGGEGATLAGETWAGDTKLSVDPFKFYSQLGTEGATPDIAAAVQALVGTSVGGTITAIDYTATGQLSNFTFNTGTWKVTYTLAGGYGTVTSGV